MKRSGPFRTLSVLLCFCTMSLWAQLLQAEPWKFGVMGDTQWTTTDPAGANPSSVPISIIGQVNRQFIDARVKFVIQVGDLTDDGQDVSERTRAAAAQPLVDAGIGFFAFRGNHETSRSDNGYGVPVFRVNYPQNRTGEFSRSDNTRFV
ncbi:MAG: metallophosphoesterase, partial [Chlorobiaceae bacterium]|nr:metallophosphoesterase [Chlorobiaceae bacterium]